MDAKTTPVHLTYARVFDESSPSWSEIREYNMLFLRAQQNYANDMLHSRGHVFLNEIYDLLGFQRTSDGAISGWLLDTSKGGSGFINFDINEVTGDIHIDFNVDGVIYDKI